MTREVIAALSRLESLVSWYEKCHPGSNLAKEYEAVEVLRREIGKVEQVAAIYHEGIESITSRKTHNDWVDSLIDDVEWEPLRDFLTRLKEPEVGSHVDVEA